MLGGALSDQRKELLSPSFPTDAIDLKLHQKAAPNFPGFMVFKKFQLQKHGHGNSQLGCGFGAPEVPHSPPRKSWKEAHERKMKKQMEETLEATREARDGALQVLGGRLRRTKLSYDKLDTEQMMRFHGEESEKKKCHVSWGK